jgi:hypothetical protein
MDRTEEDVRLELGAGTYTFVILLVALSAAKIGLGVYAARWLVRKHAWAVLAVLGGTATFCCIGMAGRRRAKRFMKKQSRLLIPTSSH